MPTLKRNAKWLSAVTLLFLMTGAGWWLLSWHAPAAAADEPQTPLDAVATAQIDQLRDELGLDDDALTVLDLSQEQAESVLQTLRGWYETNKAELLGHRAALGDQRALVRHYASQIRQGNDAADDLATARTQLAQLSTGYDSYVGGARLAVDQLLSDEQEQLVDRMKSQTEVAMPFRALDLTAAQKSSLADAQAAYRKRLATAEDDDARTQIRAIFSREMASILGPDNLQQLDTLYGYLGPASQRLVAAIQTVLPPENGEG